MQPSKLNLNSLLGGLPEGEPFPGETLRADGWVYREFNWTAEENFEQTKAAAGEGEIRMLAYTRHPATRRIRGQFFISPLGVQRLLAYLEELKAKQQ